MKDIPPFAFFGERLETPKSIRPRSILNLLFESPYIRNHRLQVLWRQTVQWRQKSD